MPRHSLVAWRRRRAPGLASPAAPPRSGMEALTDAMVADMAAFYGIRPEEQHLMWIAKQACVEPLPAGWTEYQDENGRNFFFNAETQESTFDNPLDGTFRFLIEKERRKQSEVGSGVAGTEGPVATRPPRGRGRGRGRRGGGGGDGSAVDGPAAPPAAVAATSSQPPPDATVVADMALYLGIDPATEPHLVWLAQEAVAEPLPPEWNEYTDPEGNPYYHHTLTDTTTYTHPLDAKHRARIERERQNLAAEAGAVHPASTRNAAAAAAEAGGEGGAPPGGAGVAEPLPQAGGGGGAPGAAPPPTTTHLTPPPQPSTPAGRKESAPPTLHRVVHSCALRAGIELASDKVRLLFKLVCTRARARWK